MKSILAALAGGALLPLALCAAPEPSNTPAYQLVMIYNGEAFVMDYGLSHSDCTGSIPQGDLVHGIRYACEREA